MNISEIDNRAYQWRGIDGGWQVGKPLIVDGLLVTRRICCTFGVGKQIVMQPSHAGSPTWVPVSELQPYPVEPIEEPAVKGGVA